MTAAQFELTDPLPADEQAITAVVRAAAAAIGRTPALVLVVVEGERSFQSLFRFDAAPAQMAQVLNELAAALIARAEAQLVVERARGEPLQ